MISLNDFGERFGVFSSRDADRNAIETTKSPNWSFLASLIVLTLGVFDVGAFGATSDSTANAESAPAPLLRKEGKPIFPDGETVMEATPFHWNGRALLLASVRPFASEHSPDSLRLRIVDVDSGAVVSEFAPGCSLASAFVERRSDGDVLRVYAARQPEGERWFRDVVSFKSRDLKTWEESIALRAENGEHLLNTSVCADSSDGNADGGAGYIAAYESDSPVSFCFKFARSNDLENWEKIPNVCFAGPDGKTYSACPVLRRWGEYYYVVYLRANGRGGFESALVRSKDLRAWEESPRNPILAASEGEGINNSDVDLFERDGETWVYYATGDQATWCDVRRASFDGTEREFFEACFAPLDGSTDDATGTTIDATSAEPSDAKPFETPVETTSETASESFVEPSAEPSNVAPGFGRLVDRNPAVDDRPFGENRFTGDEKERRNVYVSKLGDDSDGASWATAFNSVQKALDSIPDANGGFRIVVRPDRYFEPNLLPANPGAKGNYNELVGDFDGRFGGGATGWVYLDSSDPARGYASYDWHSSLRAYRRGWSAAHSGETVSSLAWDRWIIRRCYATGGDAGLFCDCLDETRPFSFLVEDCVSIGRAFGIGVAFGAFDPATTNVREDEPIVFRRVWAATLDRWGDAGAAFLRSCRPTLAPRPEFYLEDCVLVSPDNAVENNCAEYDGSTYVALKGCSLIALNFTQPAGDPPHTGLIRTPNDGARYRVDLEDCELAGCKIFSDEKPNPPQYSLKGTNRVYVQYNNAIPDGTVPFEGWPAELFSRLAPPKEPK